MSDETPGVTCLYAGRYLGLFEASGWEYVSRTNASGVVVLVAVNEQRQLILVEQFRPPLQKNVVELPAGLAGDLEDPEESLLDAAHRELLEETGYAAGHMRILLSAPSTAGMSDEIITFVLATELDRVGPGGGDASEDIVVHEVALDEVDGWLQQRISSGTPVDPKIFSALYWLGKDQA